MRARALCAVIVSDEPVSHAVASRRGAVTITVYST